MSQIKDSIPGPQGYPGIQGPLSMPVSIDGKDGEDSIAPPGFGGIPSGPSGLNWVDVPYNAGDFGNWTVAAIDIEHFRYAISGDAMCISFNLTGDVPVGFGPARIKIPAGKTAVNNDVTFGVFWLDVGGGPIYSPLVISGSGTWLNLRDAIGYFQLQAGHITFLTGQIWIKFT